MRKNLLRKYLVPAVLIILVLYLVYKYTNSEGFQNSFKTNNGANGKQGEVEFPIAGQSTNTYLRLHYTKEDPVTKQYKCIVPNPNPHGFKSYLYKPKSGKDFVSPPGKKICMTFRGSQFKNLNDEFNSTLTGTLKDEGEVTLTPESGNKVYFLRLQYTTNGICKIPENNTQFKFNTYLYNPDIDSVSPKGKKICITTREVNNSARK